MAKHLARIHGTEEDKVNCPFYFKIGACRHSDRCSRLHHKPAFSATLLIKHVYQHPIRKAEQEAGMVANTAAGGAGAPSKLVDPEQAMEDFLEFFEDMYMEFSKFGRIDCLHVVDNLGDHMIGHTYIKYMDEEDASDALQMMHGRFYDGRPLQVEFSPVTDFREARCRDFDEDACARGGFCNFLHVKPVPMCLIRSLEEDSELERRKLRDEQHRGSRDDRDDRRKHKKRKRERRDRDRDDRKRSRSNSSSKRHHRDDDDYDQDEDEGGNNNDDDRGADEGDDDRRRRRRGRRGDDEDAASAASDRSGEGDEDNHSRDDSSRRRRRRHRDSHRERDRRD